MRDNVQRPGRNSYRKQTIEASGTADESWHHQRSNPGTLNQITPPIVGFEPLRQTVVSEVPTPTLLYYTNIRKKAGGYIRQ